MSDYLLIRWCDCSYVWGLSRFWIPDLVYYFFTSVRKLFEKGMNLSSFWWGCYPLVPIYEAPLDLMLGHSNRSVIALYCVCIVDWISSLYRAELSAACWQVGLDIVCCLMSPIRFNCVRVALPWLWWYLFGEMKTTSFNSLPRLAEPTLIRWRLSQRN